MPIARSSQIRASYRRTIVVSLFIIVTWSFSVLWYSEKNLQHIQNSLARTVVQAPKFQHITPILKSIHWLKVSEQIEYKIISFTKFSIPLRVVSIWPRIYSASSWSQHTLFALCHSHQTIIITQSHSSILPTCFSSSLEPASYITQDSSSKLLTPLSATFIWTCQFNFLHTAITFHDFFTVSLWAQNLPFQKILSSTLVCFCLSDWSHGSEPFAGLICSSVLCFSSIFFCFSYS